MPNTQRRVNIYKEGNLLQHSVKPFPRNKIHENVWKFKKKKDLHFTRPTFLGYLFPFDEKKSFLCWFSEYSLRMKFSVKNLSGAVLIFSSYFLISINKYLILKIQTLDIKKQFLVSIKILIAKNLFRDIRFFLWYHKIEF